MLTYPFTLNNVTYVEGDFSPFGYATKLGEAFWNLVNQSLLGYGSTSATSVNLSSLPTPVVMTISAGLAWIPGDFVVAVDSANPTTKGVGGVITAYDFVTGSISFTPNFSVGAGSVSSWNVMPSYYSAMASDTRAVMIEEGGTGYGNIDGTFGAANAASLPGAAALGLNAPRAAMEEIFVDFAFETAQVSATGLNMPPFNYSNLTVGTSEQNLSNLAAADNNTYFGGVALLPTKIAPLASGVFTYNTGGFMHLGRGRVRYETVIVNLNCSGFYRARFGLRAQNSSNPNIFSYGGIGFEAFNANSGMGSPYDSGLIVCVCGSTGVVTRVVTNVAPSAGVQRFSIEVDAMAQSVKYYINDVLVATITANIPVSDYRNLLHPAYEVPGDSLAFTASTPNYLLVDTLFVSKALLR